MNRATVEALGCYLRSNVVGSSLGISFPSVAGAQLFLWARLAYAVIYLAGIPYLRTAVWLVSIVGLVLIFLQVL